MLVYLNGQFGPGSQAKLHKAFGKINGPVTFDVSGAWLSSSALAEVVCLARRVDPSKVTLANPGPLLRRLLTVSGLDRVVSVVDPGR